MKHIIEIFRNLGTIVILSLEIIYIAIIDYIRPHDKPKPDTKNKTVTSHDVSSNNEHEVVHERPHYK